LLFAACGSVILGSLFAANELKIKKFLAYSSINQFGFVLINFINVNIVPAQSVLSSFFFVIIYLIMNMSLIMILSSTFSYVQASNSVLSSKHVAQYWLIPEKRDVVIENKILHTDYKEKKNLDI